jgi:hypothetical protein
MLAFEVLTLIFLMCEPQKIVPLMNKKNDVFRKFFLSLLFSVLALCLRGQIQIGTGNAEQKLPIEPFYETAIQSDPEENSVFEVWPIYMVQSFELLKDVPSKYHCSSVISPAEFISVCR